MKQLFFLLAFCSLHFSAFSQPPITAMSKPEADKLLTKLRAEKYLFFYCDCCSMEKASWVKIQTLVVEKVSESEELYAIRMTGTKQMTFESDLSGNFYKPAITEEKIEELVPLNYAMIPQGGRGLPVGYYLEMTPEKIKACMDFIYYPHASDTRIFGEITPHQSYKEYNQWYQNNIQPALSSTAFVGSWEPMEMCENAITCKEFPGVMKPAKSIFEANGKASLIVASQNDKGTWKLENGKIYVTDANKAVTILGFRIVEKGLRLRYIQEHKTTKEEGEIMIVKLKRLQ